MNIPANGAGGTPPTRDLARELREGIAALADARAGKRTLRTHTVPVLAPLLIGLVGGYPDTIERLASI